MNLEPMLCFVPPTYELRVSNTNQPGLSLTHWQDTDAGPVERPFRFKVTPKSKVNCFKPKAVDGDLMNARYSQFGGCFTNFEKLPKSSNCQVVWEVRLDKPKRRSRPVLHVSVVSLSSHVSDSGSFGIAYTLKVRVTDAVPAVLQPIKPKYYWLSVTSVPAKTAVLLQ